MGRSACCEKVGLKKGPWTPQEDQVLINFITLHGHPNWRALPKQAGLLRCGKSCRLRWTNYLRPDIKRGNFTHEEEETIINLHEKLGNRWSIIAARLPGRTDNEIKNVWHTHLKKRLLQTNSSTIEPAMKRARKSKKDKVPKIEDVNYVQQQNKEKNNDEYCTMSQVDVEVEVEVSPQSSTSSTEISSCSQLSYNNNGGNDHHVKTEEDQEGDYFKNLVQAENESWMDVISDDFRVVDGSDNSNIGDLESQLLELNAQENDMAHNFWYHIFIRSHELSQLL